MNFYGNALSLLCTHLRVPPARMCLFNKLFLLPMCFQGESSLETTSPTPLTSSCALEKNVIVQLLIDTVFYGCQLKLIMCFDLDTYHFLCSIAVRGSLNSPTMVVNFQFCQFYIMKITQFYIFYWINLLSNALLYF